MLYLPYAAIINHPIVVSASIIRFKPFKFKTMSKDKQAVKEKKKPAAPGGKKSLSDYQTGKGDVVKPIMEAAKKKK